MLRIRERSLFNLYIGKTAHIARHCLIRHKQVHIAHSTISNHTSVAPFYVANIY